MSNNDMTEKIKFHVLYDVVIYNMQYMFDMSREL